MAKVSPIQFFRQVRQEVKKVSWPSRQEARRSTVMVIALVAVASVFFFFVDLVLGWVVRLILG